MTTLVATLVGGTRAWTDPLTWTPNQTPLPGDDCQLTVASGPVTINAGAVARSLDCNGYIGTLTHTAAVTLTLGDGTAGLGNIALRLAAGMTYTKGSTTTSAISLVSTSATQQTINTAAKTMGNLTINGAGSSYVLAAAITGAATTTNFIISAGTFDTANFAMSWGIFQFTGAGTKVLSLGSSAVAITGSSAGGTAIFPGTGATITANTAVMTFSGATSLITDLSTGGFGGNYNGLSLVFATTVTSARISATGASATFNNVTYTNGAIKTSTLIVFGSITTTGLFTVTGNSTVNRPLASSTFFAVGMPIGTITAASVSFANVDFQNVSALGAAIPWTGTSMGDATGNTNITFDASVPQTRTGAGGNWSTAANWTSRVPLPQDDVTVAGAASGTITADMPRWGRNVSFAGFTGTLAQGAVGATVCGSFTLGAGMTAWTSTAAIMFIGRGVHLITSNGKAFPVSVTVQYAGGSYTLADALVITSVTGIFQVQDSKTLNSANFSISVGAILVLEQNGVPTVNLGTSTATLTGTGTVLIVSFIVPGVGFNGSAATFILSTASAVARTIQADGVTLGTLTYTVAGSTGSLSLVGNLTIGTLNFSDASNARSLLLSEVVPYIYIFTNFNVNGTAGKLMTIDTATAVIHTLSKSSGTVSCDYLSIKNSHAQGGAYWYAGANSVDQGGNAGWKFRAAPNANEDSSFFYMFEGPLP